jgi:putative oxidoreductase
MCRPACLSINLGSRAMNNYLQAVNRMVQYAAAFNYLEAPLWLVGRIYVASIFFMSGLTKLDDWETTLYLFE